MKLEWVPTNMVGGKKWYLYGYRDCLDSEGTHYRRKEVVMYLKAEHRLTPRARRFIGWDVYRINSMSSMGHASEKVGPRIFRLKKAQEFAEVIWRMG
jgi:hypothetical protein